MTTKPVSIRLAVVNGKAVKSEFQQVGAAGAEAMGRLERASGSMGQGVQNAAYQVGDFAVQVAGGTDPIRAMAQQLPQLLGAFGVFGAVAGAAAAILAPFIGQLFDFGDAAEEAQEAMKQMGETGEAYRQSLEALQIPLGKLRGEFGLFAENAREVQVALASIAQVRYFQALSDFSTAMGENLQGAAGYLEEYRTLQAEIAAGDGLQYDAAAAQKDIIADVREEYGLTVQSLQELSAAQEQLASASGPVEMAAAYQAIGDAIMAGLNATGEMNPEMLAVAESAYRASLEAQAVASSMTDAEVAASTLATVDIASGIAAAGDEAVFLAQQLGISVAHAAALAGQAAKAKAKAKFSFGAGGGLRDDFGMAGSSGLGFGSNPGSGTVSGDPVVDWSVPEVRGRGGRGGGGGGGADREAAEAQREVERWIKATRTEAEQYAIEMERLNELHAQWGLDAETYARAVEQIGEKYEIAGNGAKYWSDAMEDARGDLLDALAAGEDLTDVMDSLAMSIKRAAWEALLFGDGPMGNGSGLLSGLWGGLQGLLSGGVDTATKLSAVASKAAAAPSLTEVVVTMDESTGKLGAFVRRESGSMVKAGIAQYDKQALPLRLKQISADKRRVN